MAIFTKHAATRLDERFQIDARELERLMRAQGLSFTPGVDIKVSGYGTLLINNDGKVTTVLAEDMARVMRVKQ